MASAPEENARYGDRHHSSRDYDRGDRERRHREDRDGHRDRDRERYESRRHSERDPRERDRDRERYGRGGGGGGGGAGGGGGGGGPGGGGGGGGGGAPAGREDYEEYARRHRDDDRRRERRGDDDHGHRRPPRDDDRGDRRGRGRHRDGLGTPERRSPTPPEAVPLSQRKRKASGWDVHAPGYEQYTAMQAKQTGLFNLPGANRTQIPPILAIPGLPPPMPVSTFGMGTGVNPNLSRQSRRLYIGSITPDINEQNLTDFFNSKMKEMNLGTGAPGNPVLAVQCNYEKNYAFVEFRSAEDATAAMAFDGIIFLNGPLKIRRPKDYGGPDLLANMHVPGVVSTNVPDSANKIFVGGLPTYLNEEQVMELLSSFGELKAFNLVRENGNGVSKGFAFFEYVDPGVTDVAIQSLSGMELGDKYLVVQRASVGAKPGQSPIPGMYEAAPEIPKPILPVGERDLEATQDRILLMLNMVVPEELSDDQEYADIYEDVKEEAERYGSVEDLRIPRPVKKDKAKWGEGRESAIAAQRADEAAGVGRVYVKFHDSRAAADALKALAGRSFAGRSIIATLLSDDANTTPPLNLIFAPQPDAPPPLPQD